MKTTATEPAEMAVIHSSSWVDYWPRAVIACAWSKRAQLELRSFNQRASQKDKIQHMLLAVVLLYTLVMLTYWVAAWNYKEWIGIFVYQKFGTWVEVWLIFFALACIALVYLLILVIFICLSYHGRWRVNIHVSHISLVTACGVGFVAVSAILSHVWVPGWPLALLFWQVTFPVLFGLVLATSVVLAWPVAMIYYRNSHWNRSTRPVVAVSYITWMVVLLLSPVFLNPPCVLDNLPPRPGIVCHRGGCAHEPENTLLAYQKSVQHSIAGVETDIMISADGIPYLMHDSTLERTTNIRDVFPSRVKDSSRSFNFSNLQKLDIGSWYTKRSSYGKSHSGVGLAEQRVVSLRELLMFLKPLDVLLMFDIQMYRGKEDFDIIYSVIKDVGFPTNRIAVFPDKDISKADSYFYHENIHVSRVEHAFSPEQLSKYGVTIINGQHNQFSIQHMRYHQSRNFSIQVYLVNTNWMYCLYWCLGVKYTTSDRCHDLSEIKSNSWHMTSEEYRILWIVLDVVSIIIISGIFLFQKWRSTRQRTEIIAWNS